MALTLKEFTLKVTEEIQKSPRKILGGHGLSPLILNTIASRPDIIAKLSVGLYSTKLAKRGPVGLKKSKYLQIFGYKTFNDFMTKSVDDIESFVENLSDDDKAKFNNSQNIIAFLIKPSKNTGDDNNDIEKEIIAGESVAITFDTAIDKKYRIPGAIYVLMIFGSDSMLRPVEEKTAERKQKLNKRKQKLRTPAKIKAELNSKVKKNLEVLNREALEEVAMASKIELDEINSVANQFGIENVTDNLGDVVTQKDSEGNTVKFIDEGGVPDLINNMKNFDDTKKEALDIIETFSADEKSLYDLAVKNWKSGNRIAANRALRTLDIPKITDFVHSGVIKTSKEVLTNRVENIKIEITALTRKNEQYLSELEGITDPVKRHSVQSMISRNINKVKTLRLKLGTYKNISPKGMANKAIMFKEAHKLMLDGIDGGMTIKEALDASIGTLNASEKEKAIITQEIIEKIAEGSTPPQFAVQQTIQNFNNTNHMKKSAMSGAIMDLDAFMATI